MSGSGRDPDKVYISQATDKVLSAAAREAKAMKDEYVSVEHVFLGLLDELGYQGVVGCEYNPAGKTVDGLGWIRAFDVVPNHC